MELGELYRGDIVKFLEMINERQASEIEYLREQNRLLLDKVLTQTERPKISVGNQAAIPEPIPRKSKPLRMRIAEAEEQSIREYNELLEKEQENAS